VQHVVGLRKDFLLEVRGVRDWTVERRDATDWRVEMVEELVGDAGGDLRAEPARQLILVRDDHAIRLLDERADPRPVVRDQRAQIEDRDAQALSACHHRARCTNAPHVITTTSVPRAFRLLRQDHGFGPGAPPLL
jgi:hypothetical protein